MEKKVVNKKKKKKGSFKDFLKSRTMVQMIATLLTNIHLPNFFKGTLYQGKGKIACVPGLNCYSCPGATGACPIGSFQAVVGSRDFSLAYYVTGIIIFFGVVFARFICGFLCPFGWFQDMLHKIPSKKFRTTKLKFLTYTKYIILLVAVIILPTFLNNKAGLASPYFCKYICPQGILEGGIPLSIANPAIRATLGKLFTWKFCILLTIIILSILIYRPFCKWICPLGALYALFNKFSLLHYKVDENTCISCGKCARTCKMEVDITKNTAHMECIRCGECVKVCPTKAISVSWGPEKMKLLEKARELNKNKTTKNVN